MRSPYAHSRVCCVGSPGVRISWGLKGCPHRPGDQGLSTSTRDSPPAAPTPPKYTIITVKNEIIANTEIDLFIFRASFPQSFHVNLHTNYEV